MTSPLDKLNSRIFAAQLHTKFKVHFPNPARVSLELVEVMDRDASPEIELFSLQFLGPLTPRLEQQIYRLEHETLGEFEVFLTAIGADPGRGIQYECVFHRFRKAAP